MNNKLLSYFFRVQKMANRIQTNPSFNNMSADRIEFMMDGIEKYIMTHIYKGYGKKEWFTYLVKIL